MNIENHLEDFKNEIRKVIVGQDEVLDLIFISIIKKGHILFESVPGTGKTTLSKALARTIGGSFNRIQFTPDLLPTDITGLNMYNPKTHDFELQIGPIDTNVLLADEINRATPRTQSALLEVMEERQITIDGKRIEIADPFIVLATQNPIESTQGTFSLPEAQMDRFLMRIDLGYPSRREELDMMTLHSDASAAKAVQPVFSEALLAKLQIRVANITVDPSIREYMLDIIEETRHHEHVDVGVSPRGTLALMHAAQGVAMIRGRDYVTPDDIKYIAPYVLPHRLVLSLEGLTLSDQNTVLKAILDDVEVPVEYGVSPDAL
ncbi:MoxR family ATPase [Salinicoccus sp. ID82-1]|uniref:AAA family ATPase n=1 Tax=Salinicoccus sp. ID82-1 TaxID=2820269 RepID=UPI001F20721C|nr:MoxR family ATPase [Salinicoccus sp. ID82-1]MCG1010449.1 MoxR family ATPase [Salinicoccus sp. ID82-1]